MNGLIDTIKYRGYDIEIYQDEHAESPDQWGDDEQFLVYDHRSFYVSRKGFDCRELFDHWNTSEKLYDGYYVIPVYAYIHSGVALSLGNFSRTIDFGGWDTSFKGFALIKRQKGTWTKKEALKLAEGLIETWNEYLSGEVYGYISEAGSCFGFYGDTKYMIEEAKAEIDWLIKDNVIKHIFRRKQQIRYKVPLKYRKEFAV